jgi:hypothetical protein
MRLGNIIEELKKHDPETKIHLGFCEPHSYRGIYSELAFEPCKNTKVGDMLKCCERAKKRIFEGYKGGEFTYNNDTECHLAWYGSSGETLGRYLLMFMLGETEWKWVAHDFNE